MPVVEIGSLGTKVDSRGVVKKFTPEFFQEVAESYDPSNFKAPAIISHDTKGIADDKLHKNKELSYGVVDKVKVVGDRLKLFFKKLSPKIKEHFDNGELLAVSPSFYPPNHHANPSPGRWSLRHAAFLGATPPAIKGLNVPEFSETGYDPEQDTLDFSFAIAPQENDGVLEFSIYSQSIRSLLSNIRDWMIETTSKDEAEKILPAEAIAQIDMEDRYLQDELSDLRRELMKLKYSEAKKLEPVPSSYTEEADLESDFNEGKTMKHKSKTKHKNSKPHQEEMLDEEEEEEFEDDEDTTDMNEEYSIDFAELQSQLEEERNARKRLELQVQNSHRVTELERQRRRNDKITNFCEQLVKDGYLTAAQMGDRIIEFNEGEEEQLNLPSFLMSLDSQQLSFMEDFLQTQPKVINYGEVANDGERVNRNAIRNYSVVEGASVTHESASDMDLVLEYCEKNNLNSEDPADFDKAAIAVLG